MSEIFSEVQRTEPRSSEVFFSIVMPVYGTELYLAETLDSILAQDANLLAQTEIIIVNDGSPDNSEAVCLEYAEKYPHLIRYILQENQGVSVARNRGIEEARGTLIGFIDSDDKYSPTCFSIVKSFWEKHKDEIDVIAMPLHFFDGSQGEHPLNFKFKQGTRIIDTSKEFDAILLHITGTFIPRETLISSGLRFDPTRKYSEDKLFLTELIMQKQKYGLLCEPIIHYRKRANKSSAIQGSVLDPSWYQDTLIKVDIRLVSEFSDEDYLPQYVQYVIAYDLQWRVKQTSQHVLSAEEQTEYLALFGELLGHIDEEVIMALRNIYAEHKLYLIKLRNGEDPLQTSEYEQGVFKHKGTKIAAYTKGNRISTIELIHYENGQLTLQGYFFGLRFKGIRYGYFVNSEFHEVDIYHDSRADITFLGDTVFDRNVYRVTLEVKAGDRIRPAVRRPDGTVITGTYLLKNLSHLPEGTISYFEADQKTLLQNVRNSYIAVKKNTFIERQRLEYSFLQNTVLHGAKTPIDISKKDVLKYRASARLGLSLQRLQKIWLISDRPDSAGDNGEAFFEYVCKNKPENIEPYFVLSQTSPDYPRLSAIGKVVDPRTDKYKKLFLRADKIISSQANDYVINVFGRDQNLFRDLYKFDFVFLQHGVTLHNVSSWLHHFAKDIKKFVTVASRERFSILEGNYGYDKNTVVLTGFPRHDKLVNRREKKIVVAPTWRHWLVGAVDPKTLTVPYNEDFKESTFYEFYQSLITHPELNEALQKYGYTAEFLIHPSFNLQIKDFHETERFKLSAPPHNYNRAFAEAALMVTDYSSVAFDFAYLRKPVLYTQFDKAEFYEGHPWGEGYYSFDRDGFGPVTTSLEETVQYLITSMATDCLNDPQYIQRVNDFFCYQDRNNSERLLNVLLKDY